MLNIFHYGFDTWEEIGPGALLMNSAAMVQFRALDQGTYLPYARALRKIEKEESFHYHHAIDLTHQTMVRGSGAQRRRVQEAFETWLPRLLAYFGPPDSDVYRQNAMYQFGLKVKSNDALRQEWLTEDYSRSSKNFRRLVEPALAHFNADRQEWDFAAPDWVETKRVIVEGGPRFEEWRSKIESSLERNRIYREVALNRAAS